jgi:hypothetical protein
MTLKERILPLVADGSYVEITARTIEDIADDFAIGFAEWFLNLSKSDDWEKFDYNTTEKLLKIYKNEKGL